MTPAFPPRFREGPTGDEERSAGQLLNGLPTLPTADVASARMWRSLHAKRQPPRFNALYAALAGGLAVAAVALVATRLAQPTVQLLASAGRVYVSDTSGWTARAQGSLRLAQHVRTDAEAKALLGLGEVASVLIAPGSEASVEQVRHGTVLRLASGQLTARVSPRPHDEPFVVHCDDYTVRVVGTLFTVARSPEGATTVSVREGTVDVLREEQRIARVTAGHKWSSASVVEQSDETSDQVKALLEASLRDHPLPTLSAELEATYVAVAAPAATTTAPALLPLNAAPTASALTAPRSSERSVLHSTGTPVERGEPEAPSTAPMPATEQPSPVLLVPLPPSYLASTTPMPAPEAIAPQSPPVKVPDAYDLAQDLWAHGDFAGAARELEEVVASEPERKETALYQLGRLRFNELHDPARSLESFRRYRQQFPEGTFRPEVDYALVRAEVQLKDEGNALTDATRFLSEHPTYEHVPDVHFLRAELYRARREFAAAADDYRTVTTTSNAADALWLRAFCQQQLGDTAGKLDTLRTYVAKYPEGAHQEEARRVLNEGR